ncbi:MAG: xanthine dehydrogenase family protein molybdopterin-binding subunit, partial [Holophagales bacterium]|nr:xanthine dehydrogenase family protein molybdopterin-binding subunit [Holophagales bacterium]
MAKTLVGTDYAPPDLIEKITGRAKYAEDWRAEGMLFAKQLLSPMPHARVRNIDASAALAMEGVEAVLTADDLAEYMGEPGPLDERSLTNHPKYEGEPVLAVAAVSEKIAADAIEKIRVDFEPLPFALDPLDSIAPGGSDSLPDGNSIVRQRTDTGVETVVQRVEWTAEDLATARGSNGEKGRMPEGVFQD